MSHSELDRLKELYTRNSTAENWRHLTKVWLRAFPDARADVGLVGVELHSEFMEVEQVMVVTLVAKLIGPLGRRQVRIERRVTHEALNNIHPMIKFDPVKNPVSGRPWFPSEIASMVGFPLESWPSGSGPLSEVLRASSVIGRYDGRRDNFKISVFFIEDLRGMYWEEHGV